MFDYFCPVKNFRRQQRPKKSELVAGIEAVAVAIREGEHFDRVYIDAKASRTRSRN